MQCLGVVDSLNFSSKNLESYFADTAQFCIEIVKGIGIFEPQRWREVFKRRLTRNIVEAKILHTSMGLSLPIKRQSRTQNRQTIEFAGLHSYTEKSKFLSELLQSLWGQIQNELIIRIDVAIDFEGKIPSRIFKALKKLRGKTYTHWNTTYFKSKSEKKENNRLNIKTYSKSNKEKLDKEIQRLEFSFLSSYFQKLTIKEMDKAIKKMEKTIKRFSGLDVKIASL